MYSTPITSHHGEFPHANPVWRANASGDPSFLGGALIPTNLLNSEWALFFSPQSLLPCFSLWKDHSSHPYVTASNMSTFSTDLLECKISHIPSDHMPVNATPASHLLVTFPLAQPREESSFPLTFSAAQLHKVTRFSPVAVWRAAMIHAVLSWLTIPSHIDCSILNDHISSQYPCIHFKNILDNLWGKRNIETHSQNDWVRMTCWNGGMETLEPLVNPISWPAEFFLQESVCVVQRASGLFH